MSVTQVHGATDQTGPQALNMIVVVVGILYGAHLSVARIHDVREAAWKESEVVTLGRFNSAWTGLSTVADVDGDGQRRNKSAVVQEVTSSRAVA